MKRITVFGLLLLFAILAMACGGGDEGPPATSGAATSPAPPPPSAPPGRGQATVTVGGHLVSIDYGRPQLSGRDMLSQLGVGQTWRFGRDQATVIQLGTDLQFGTTTVAAGSYSLFLKKASADAWHLIFNRQTGQWGTDHDAAQDAYEIPLTVGSAPDKVETFTIDLEGGDSTGKLTVSWDTLRLTAEFKTAA